MTAGRSGNPGSYEPDGDDPLVEIRRQMRSLSERIDALAADADDLAPYFDDVSDEPVGIDEGADAPWGPSPILEAKLAALEAAEREMTLRRARQAEDPVEATPASSRDPEPGLAPDPPPDAPEDVARRPAGPVEAPDPVATAPPTTTHEPPARRPGDSTAAAAAAAVPASVTSDAAGSRAETAELPGPVDERNRSGRMFIIFALLALVAVAFVAGGWWAGRDGADDAATTPAEAAADAAESLTSAAPPAEVDDETDAALEDTTAEAATGGAAVESEAEEAPATTAVVLRDPDQVVAEATEALAAAGHSAIAATYDDGILTLTGVLPADQLSTGYFGQLDTITAVVADIDGITDVVPRLYLRGDDGRLRRALSSIAEDNPIEFDLASADLTDGARTALRDAAEVILANPGLRVLVAGHTDASGSAEANAALASARSAAVIQELVSLGVPITRLQPVAYGELFPDAAGTDAQNRRVAFEVAP